MTTASVHTTDVKTLPIMISLLVSAFLGMFSEMSLNVALGSLMKELSVSTTTVQWLTTGYMLVISILVPVSALLLQLFTTRQLFITALSLFTLGTLVAAISPSFAVLLMGRLIQAAGTGLLIPLMINTILLITPAEKRGSVMGLIGLIVMFAPAIAPTVAGLILQYLDWHWLFWVLIPFLILDIGFGCRSMQNVSEVRKIKIDFLSILLSTIGFGGLVYGLSSAGEGVDGWSHPTTIIALVTGLVVVILFVWRQLTMKEPMLDLRVLKYPMFSLGMVLVIITMLIIFSFLLLTPLYLQNGLKYSTYIIGLVLLPGGVLNGLISPVTGRLFDKFGPTRMVIPGMIIVAVTLWFFSRVTLTSTMPNIIILHCFLMIGVSMIMMPAQTNGLNQLPRRLYPHGTAVMNTVQQLAGAVGTALCVTTMNAGQRSYLAGLGTPGASELTNALIAGIQNSFTLGFDLAVIGLLMALLIKRAYSSQSE
ncbi:MDR family MFS transporter [Sporomusa malonica]|uniref:MFS transporter, DHA2 family, lincomycin resistance protein n=1 Tax=Sporomusa malonica TaxID=112901 RepID=A0A1W1Y7X5_9FIRM|nr:MDR family MFS transporter [Sporomusa malonica]SMC32272.1 MFS transporter, DHA2 family, lincomycin resistance protein [Sporomusa malonica]